MGIAYEKIPKEMLEQFRQDMMSLPYTEFLKWPPYEVQQVIALMIADFEAIMLPDEHMELRNAYLSSSDQAEQQRFLYEHYQAALRRRYRGSQV
jgi:hypothetical protein